LRVPGEVDAVRVVVVGTFQRADLVVLAEL